MAKIPSGFWNQFKSRYWQKKPGIIQDAGAVPLPRLTREELFGLVSEAVSNASKTKYKSTSSFRLYLNNRQVAINKDSLPLLPHPEDGSFVQYHKRCISQRGVKEHGLIINNLHQLDWNLWEKLCLGFKPLFETMGLAQSYFETFMFIGNYSKTPLGVHVDPSTVFHVPLVGTKEMRLWKSEYALKNIDLQRTVEYKKHLKGSVLLKAKPGQAMYWPSDRWHIAESSNEFKVSWGFAYSFGGVANEFLRSEFENGLQTESLLPITDETIPLLGNKTIPFTSGDPILTSQNQNLLFEELQAYRRVASSDSLERKVEEKWLNHISSYGLRSSPPLKDPKPLNPDDIIQVDTHFPLLWKVRFNGECIVSNRGHSTLVPNGDWVPELLKILNAGHPRTVKELVSQFSSEKLSKKTITKILDLINGISDFQVTRTEIYGFKAA